jgi:hypothetical protein
MKVYYGHVPRVIYELPQDTLIKVQYLYRPSDDIIIYNSSILSSNIRQNFNNEELI